MQVKQFGFSLIELMVVLVVIGILAGAVYPSYVEFVARGQRNEGQVALLAFANAMERYYTTNNTYRGAAVGGADTGTPAATTFAAEAPLDGAEKTYDLSIQAADATSYTLAATPKNSQSGDYCGTLTVSSTGARGALQADCWK